jgi:hypothetical protein
MDIYELAEIMHTHLCHFNHTDYCEWFYRVNNADKWEEPYSAHKKYLSTAEKVKAETGMELEDIAKVIKAL